jgi:ATP-dependent Clp protease ATP-binding subunit ClpA
MFDRYSVRARQVIMLSRWAAGMRGAEAIELDDLLEALIREDQGEAAAIMSQGHPHVPHFTNQAGAPLPFFSKDEAQALLGALAKPGLGNQDLSVDMPVAASVKDALTAAPMLADKKGHKVVEPLHLLSVIVEDRESSLAKLLRLSGITRQRVRRGFEG